MNQEQALQLLTNALNTATLKGVFNLTDTANIITALATLQNTINNTKDLIKLGDSFVTKELMEELKNNKKDCTSTSNNK